MNISWLDDFLALDSTGNFSRAAEKRYMTQPAFGRRIKALEEWIGVDLFDRSVHPVKLTAAGEWFRTASVDILENISNVRSEARRISESTSNTLALAATHALSFNFLPNWLRKFDEITTRGMLQIRSDVLQRCESHIEKSQVHFVICHAHPDVPGKLDSNQYLSKVIGSETLIPVSLGDEDNLPMYCLTEEASTIPLLEYSDESGLGRILNKIRSQALERNVVRHAFSAHLASVLRSMVLDGKGIAWLPRTIISEDLHSGLLVPAAPESWNIELQIRLYRRRENIGLAAERLWCAAQST